MASFHLFYINNGDRSHFNPLQNFTYPDFIVRRSLQLNDCELDAKVQAVLNTGSFQEEHAEITRLKPNPKVKNKANIQILDI